MVATDTVVKRLESLRDREAIELLVLFGSHAEGRARDGSDIDIGVITTHPLEDLHRELCALLETAKVDLVNLQRASLATLWL